MSKIAREFWLLKGQFNENHFNATSINPGKHAHLYIHVREVDPDEAIHAEEHNHSNDSGHFRPFPCGKFYDNSESMNTKKIAVLVGSLRKESLNRKMAKAIAGMATNLKFEMIEIGDLPLYNEELDENPPAAWTTLRNQIKACDGVLFVTPEYNRSIPGVLKNAIDIASRPYGQNVFDQKPGAVVSVSPGAMGGFGANHHLRQTLVFLNVPTMQQPEAYFGHASEYFDSEGKIVNEKTKAVVNKFTTAFEAWVSR